MCGQGSRRAYICQELDSALVGAGALTLDVHNGPVRFVKEFLVGTAIALRQGSKVEHFIGVIEGCVFPYG